MPGACGLQLPPMADAVVFDGIDLLTAWTGLTADIVDEVDTIGWVISLASG
jgi:hypothetical protein